LRLRGSYSNLCADNLSFLKEGRCFNARPLNACFNGVSVREQSHMSQATFALALNVSTVIVSRWERGEVRPSGPSLKLLALADKKEKASTPFCDAPPN
jgi:DNA-binding transcriptional regulator YiaG